MESTFSSRSFLVQKNRIEKVGYVFKKSRSAYCRVFKLSTVVLLSISCAGCLALGNKGDPPSGYFVNDVVGPRHEVSSKSDRTGLDRGGISERRDIGKVKVPGADVAEVKPKDVEVLSVRDQEVKTYRDMSAGVMSLTDAFRKLSSNSYDSDLAVFSYKCETIVRDDKNVIYESLLPLRLRARYVTPDMFDGAAPVGIPKRQVEGAPASDQAVFAPTAVSATQPALIYGEDDRLSNFLLFTVEGRERLEFDRSQTIRFWYSASASSSGSSVNSKGSIRTRADVLIRDSDPFFNLRFSVDVVELFKFWHDASVASIRKPDATSGLTEIKDGTVLESTGYVFFYSGIGAPRSAKAQSIVSLDGDLNIVTVFTFGFSGQIEETSSSDWSRRFVLFRYQDESIVRSLIEGARSVAQRDGYLNWFYTRKKPRTQVEMFQEVPREMIPLGRVIDLTNLESSFAVSDPKYYFRSPHTVLIKNGDKYYRFSQEYLRHLTAEGVMVHYQSQFSTVLPQIKDGKAQSVRTNSSGSPLVQK